MSARDEAIKIVLRATPGEVIHRGAVASEQAERSVAALIDSGVMLLTADHDAEVERLRAIEVAFAELPASTQALAHAAATVRARLGEGWEITPKVDHEQVCVTGQFVGDSDGGVCGFYCHPDGLFSWWMMRRECIKSGSDAPSLDDAITAALAVLGKTES